MQQPHSTTHYFTVGGVVTGASDSTRAARIDTVVEQALQPFFQKN